MPPSTDGMKQMIPLTLRGQEPYNILIYILIPNESRLEW